MNTNQEIALKAISANIGATLAVQRDAAIELSPAQFNSCVGALKKFGLIEKMENGGYNLTEAGIDEVTLDVKEEDNAIAVGTTQVQSEVQKETKEEEEVAVEDDSHLYPSTPTVALNMTTLFLNDNTEFKVRTVEEKKNVTYVRLERNEHKIRAIELHNKSRIFRIYSGAQLLEPVHTFMVEMGADIKEGTHWYYNVPMTSENIEKVIKFFSPEVK